MEFKLYKLNYNDFGIDVVDNVDESLVKHLVSIEKEIIFEYLKAQEGKIGIKTLGNEIRYNENLKTLFGMVNSDTIIVKCTENKKAFLDTFVRYNTDYKTQKMYFFVLQDSFGKESNLVDKTFITIKDVEKLLKDFFSTFNFKNNLKEIYFVEMKGFTDYFVIESKPLDIRYTKIEKRKNG